MRLEVGEGWEKTMLILLLCACLLCRFLCTILSCPGCSRHPDMEGASAVGKD